MNSALPKNGPDPAEHGDCDTDPQRDHAKADRSQAHERHGDPQQPVGEAEDERVGLRVAEGEGDDQQCEVDERVQERDGLEPPEGDHAAGAVEHGGARPLRLAR